jgi:hypothetical protein
MITNASSRDAGSEKLFSPELLDEDALGLPDSAENDEDFNDHPKGEDWHSFQTS